MCINRIDGFSIEFDICAWPKRQVAVNINRDCLTLVGDGKVAGFDVIEIQPSIQQIFIRYMVNTGLIYQQVVFWNRFTWSIAYPATSRASSDNWEKGNIGCPIRNERRRIRLCLCHREQDRQN